MRLFNFFLSILLFLFSLSLKCQTSGNQMVLWYRQPAADWNEALPVGNGRLGAMVFGNILH
ncbi:MAG TPA: glycoside hydrolase N-terminal domain-containing protein, partial [Bacteroidales bacterium]|nr:glycoside hydrolase N-terminal domain-containing protein [Bacteroidales bacterium]